MPAQLRLEPYQIADIAKVRDLGPIKLEGLVQGIDRHSPPPLSPQELHRLVLENLRDESDAGTVLSVALALYGLIRRSAFTLDDVMNGLRHALQPGQSGWTQSDYALWGECETAFRNLLDSKALRTVAKAANLAYEYANLLQTARVVCDMRPVFSDDDEDQLTIDGAVVSFTLRIYYDNQEGSHSISIACDLADIQSLQHQCIRATKKADVLRDQLRSGVKTSTIVVGEETA